MAMASCPCLSWSISMRNSVRGWKGWASNLCPSRICSARCSTWSNLRVQVSAGTSSPLVFFFLFMMTLSFLSLYWKATPCHCPFYLAVWTLHMHVFVNIYMLFSPGKITLGDLKRCRMAHIFFDTFFNLEKYLDHEQRDPFAVQKVWFCISYM